VMVTLAPGCCIVVCDRDGGGTHNGSLRAAQHEHRRYARCVSSWVYSSASVSAG
jgi:hypothetical protein